VQSAYVCGVVRVSNAGLCVMGELVTANLPLGLRLTSAGPGLGHLGRCA